MNDPYPNVQEGILQVEDRDHATTEFLPEQWERTDEWYSFDIVNEDVRVLMTIDEESYDGGADMGIHPMAWYHEFEGGRAFYTALGHTDDSYSEDLFLNHLLEGVRYAVGENRRLDYSKAKTQRVPEENRFTKSYLSSSEFMEPTEMAVLPNLDILVAQRRGDILLYKNSTSTLSPAASLDVYWDTNNDDFNSEDGLLGMTADPNFEENNYIYVFYSPIDTSVNRLSRFTFENDELTMDSEKIILEFYQQREICCHTGGSIAFGPDGLLYLSTGDNSTPFNQRSGEYTLDGYAPLDGREGFEHYDARRSSGNSNDLRGKILRIRVNEDGSYDIPEGNLYPGQMDKTRPEIYVQGTRNPYRISVDQKTGYLYWGDIGPDASDDQFGVRGPRGYDEINQARESGHYGWPFFVGNNYEYTDFDYATGTPQMTYDPEKPVNNSPLSTGLEELPPAKPAFIWYPYGASEDFPEIGTAGGRNAMAGPVYHTDMFPEDTRLPGYYDGKLFIYDWIRDWVKVVTLRPNGDFDKMEPFMSGTRFNAIMDMEVGPDGLLYLLEYGKGWYSKNPDAALSRIDFQAGNREPQVNSVLADQTSGQLPLEVTFSVDAADPENDPISYIWDINDETVETDEPELSYSFDQIGDYTISVAAVDPSGAISNRESVAVYAGNTAPNVHINILSNQTFYFTGSDVEYEVIIDDDESGRNATIDPSKLFVSADYIESDPGSASETSQGHQTVTDNLSGRVLAASFDCRACHHETNSSVGPNYTRIAELYKDSTDAVTYLSNKIINGGSGVWGQVSMPAHTEMKREDARKIASWIRSLADEEFETESLPASGTLNGTLGKEYMDNGVLVISASYTDEGGETIKPLTGQTVKTLSSSRVSVAEAQNLNNYEAMQFNGRSLLRGANTVASFSLNSIDLTGITSAEITASSRENFRAGYVFELRIGDPDGRLIGEAVLNPAENIEEEGFITHSLNIETEPISSRELIDLYILSRPLSEEEDTVPVVSYIEFRSE